MRLFRKSKRLGIWDPDAIDFQTDREHWLAFTQEEQKSLLHMTSLFLGGEEAVTLDLLPLIHAIASEGRIEEEMFLATFLWEEAKHIDFFARFLEEVVVDPIDLGALQGEQFKFLFFSELPRSLRRLLEDPSPIAQADASVTYNMIIEGVLAETGYHAYTTAFESAGLMPGLLQGLVQIKRDESRHIAYGVYLLCRLVAEDPQLWEGIEERMNALLIPALGLIAESFDLYEKMPFGIELEDLTEMASKNFLRRHRRISDSRGKTFQEIQELALAVVSED
jgi:ribonucleoside-diphosphate reductase beta chain